MTFTHKKIEPIIDNSLVMPSIWKLQLQDDGVRKPVPVTPIKNAKLWNAIKKNYWAVFDHILGN
jgi:hypothetical protein